jgi:hypothetical protein
MLNDFLLESKSISGKAERFSICIAGITCAIISRDNDFLEILRERYRHFETSGPAEYEVILKFLPIDTISNDTSIEGTGHIIRTSIKRVNFGNNYIIKQTVKPFLAVTNTESKKVLVKISRSQNCFNNFLRTLFTLILVKKNGLLIRATAFGEINGATLFCRNRHFRKTSISQITPETPLLAEGLVVVRPHNGHYRIYSTPFRDDCDPEKGPVRAKLNSICFPKRDQASSVSTMQENTTSLSLFKSACFFTDDSQLLNSIWENCRRVARSIPAYEMHICRNTTIGQLLKEHTLADFVFQSVIQSVDSEGIGIGR